MQKIPRTALLIENEPEWRRRLEDLLRSSGIDDVITVGSFNEAEKQLPRMDLLRISFAIIDIRLRKHLYDQGGLYLLDLLKSRRPLLPVLMASAYFDDYPGVKVATSKYAKVMIREKEEILKNSASILSFLLGEFAYTAFLSYRRLDPDQGFARDLHHKLEAAGYRVAIDERDFAANESFLFEMERCILTSQFTLALVSPRYVEGGNTSEEAVICKVLDMSERRRRLLPLILEQTQLPIWMYGLVGIDFSASGSGSIVSPLERLKKSLGDPW